MSSSPKSPVTPPVVINPVIPPVVIPPVVTPPVVIDPVITPVIPPVVIDPVITPVIPPVVIPPVVIDLVIPPVVIDPVIPPVIPPVVIPPVVIDPIITPVIPPVVIPPVVIDPVIPPVVIPPVIPPVVIPPVHIDISSNVISDISTNITITGTTDITFCSDTCFNIVDISSLLLLPSDISINSYDISFVNGMKIVTETGFTSDGTFISEIAAITIDPLNPVQITIDVSATVQQYNDEVDLSINSIMQEISMYAGKINCSDFQGKGTIDDYTELFQAASDMAKHAKQTTLNINIDGFKEFGNAADELSALFKNYIVKIENMNVINDMAFLSEILFYLKKIWNLSETFGRFKETILGTSIIKIPKSLEDTRHILDGVMTEVDCAMKYIECFISPESVADISLCCPGSHELNTDEKNQIQEAVKTIQKWNYLYNDNVQIAISENADVQFIENANAIIKNTTDMLKNKTAILKGKIKIYSCKK